MSEYLDSNTEENTLNSCGSGKVTLNELLATPEWKNGCIEEIVILDETKQVLKYTFSNSIDSIKTAIYSKTGCNINLKKALWKLNPGLSISVKHLMNLHNVNYSMTTFIRDKLKSIVVNMRVGDNWFITGFDEINGIYLNWEFLHIYLTAYNAFSSSNEDSDY